MDSLRKSLQKTLIETLEKGRKYELGHVSTWADGQKAGRLNTYLTGAPKGGMWTTKEQAEKMAPMFDKIFEAFKNSEHLKKAMGITAESPFYVGLVVVDRERKRFLIGKRKEDRLWTGPGGGANLGESPKQAVIREAFEEANLQIKPHQLKELPTLTAKNGKLIHTFLTFVDRKGLKLHVTNDPDAEVKEWIWHPLNDKLPGKTDENRLTTWNNAKMKIMGLKKAEKELQELLGKAIVSNPEAEIDINTAEESQNEAVANPEWVERISQLMEGAEYGEAPRELILPQYRKLYISKVDDGLYSGYVRLENPEDGDNGKTLTQLQKMTPASMVQALKAKEYLPLPEAKPQDILNEQKESKRSQLADILTQFSGKELHIHLHGE